MIVDKYMLELNERLSSQKVQAQLTSSARTWLAKKGYDPDFGARPLSRIMQEEIKDVLADKLLAGKLDKGKKILIDVDEQQQGLKFDVV